MAKLKYEEIKILIETATSFEEADQILSEYGEFETVEAKFKFLNGMFNHKIIDEKEGDSSNEDVYRMALTDIVNEKFRR